MAASWPSSKKTFSAVVNGVNKLLALLWNTVYDEVEALQTFFGASGNAQTKSSSMMNLFRNMYRPLPQLTWIDNATIEIEAGEVVMWSSDNYVIKRNAAAIQIVLPTDLDTGAEAASTWYDIFLIGDGADSAFTAKFVVMGNNPSGATYYKKINTVRNNASSNIIKFYQKERKMWFEVFQPFAFGNSESYAEADLTAVLPSIAAEAQIWAMQNAAGSIGIRDANSSDDQYSYMASDGHYFNAGWFPIYAGATYARALDHKVGSAGRTLTGYVKGYTINLR